MTSPADDALRARIEWRSEQVQRDLPLTPELLWHYTDAYGLKEIVRTEKLWATNTRFLNDSTEIEHGLELVERVIRDYVASTQLNQLTSRWLVGLIEPSEARMLDFIRERHDVYVACFCANGDLLGQWRAYAGRDSAGGYSLGIGTRPPAQAWVQVAGQANGLQLRRVLYDRQEQRRACERLLELLLPVLQMQPTKPDRLDAFAGALVDGVVELAACCKDPAFEEEREWRLIYLRQSDPNPLAVLHRASQGLLVPYVELQLPSPVGALAGHLPLQAIRCGPGPDPERKKRGLASLLSNTEHFSDAQILGSSTPLRL